MKKFINDPDDVVDEMLEGYLAVHDRYVRRLPGARAVARTDGPIAGKVGVVTGGGSGHKPAFIGFVGDGMLDAVAVGDIFTSPPPAAVLEAARAASGGSGVLLLLGNYAGDVMNFQLAAELAGAEGIETKQVIATDDVGSGGRDEVASRRGVVGELFAWKAAGAKAAAGGSLDECAAVAHKVNANTRTLGVAASPCTVPAKGTPSFELGAEELEYGVGHHGEAGTEKIDYLPADELVERMARQVIDDLPFARGDRVAVLVNGLGGTPRLELYICYRRLAQIAADAGLQIARSYVGEFFTALEMSGFSITLMRLDQELQELLAAPADTPELTVR